MKKLFLLSMLALISVANAKPNIVFIFIDDMGYGDIGPFGNTTNKTPNLDRLAAEGMKLTSFYVSSTACTPSRSALMTGCYADRIGMDGTVVFPADPRGLNPSEITIAEMLKEQGYATGCFGKWHLGDAPEFMPLKQGFDEYEGIPYSNDMWEQNNDMPPLPYIKQDKPVAYIPDAKSQSLMCGAVTDAAINFIERHRTGPFFAYVPYSYVHLPRLVRKEWAERADGDVTRAQIEELDAGIGRILATLRDQGLAQNTLVFFTSDNGPARGCSAGPLRGAKGGPKYEGHMRMPALAWWPGKIAAGAVCSEVASTIDILPTLGKITGGKIPTDRVIDGLDISALLFEPGAKSPHHEIFYEYEGVRVGKWKLVKLNNKFELYDLDADLGERHDLAEQYPEKLVELKGLLAAHEKMVKSARRPAGKAEHPAPILPTPGKLPTLAQYLGHAEIETVGDIEKRVGRKKATRQKDKNKDNP